MTAFAANSILNRLAVEAGQIDPSSFALIRVLSGAVVLAMLVTARGRRLPIWAKGRLKGAASLAVYMIGFSLAYMSLDAGLGALILFGTVQVSMFGWSAWTGDRPGGRALGGALVAFLGLLLALWPEPDALFGVLGAVFMVCAGIGWAVYSLAGRQARDPLGETAANFIVALPMLALLLLGPQMWASIHGVALAILSGAVTSGLGYALWYAILPQLGARRAAVVQLSVPIIAIAAGIGLLGEPMSWKLAGATLLVLGGIGLALTSGSAQAGRK